jgi:hypothetical protein
MTARAETNGERRAGRPRKPAHERTVVATVRLTPARKEKLQRLGAAWLSRALDGAMEESTC